jgi:hypothetical protein
MAASTVVGRQIGNEDTFTRSETYSSGISWAAVIAGAFVAASLWLILLTLGTGLGLSAVSPWSEFGASASTVGKGAIFWLIIVQIIASSMGGYLAGRLRIKWATIHTDEVYFRDTAHGFLVWAVGLVITAAFLASAATSMVGVAGSLRSTSYSSPPVADPNGYFIDRLLRADHPSPDRIDTPAHIEAAGIFAHALAQGNLSAADETYLADVVAARSGLSHTDAEQRVAGVFAEVQQASEDARKALAHLSLWLFIALLIGAFCASYAATIGGRERDHVKLI